MPSVNETLAERYRVHAVDLLRFDAHEREVILGYLKQLEQELVRLLLEIDPASVTQRAARRNRLQALLDQVRKTVQTTYGEISTRLIGDLTDLAKLEAQFARTSAASVIGFDLLSATITAEALRAIASDVLILGAPSAEWWSRQAVNLVQAFSDQIRLGMGIGESIEDMVRRIRGRATGARNWYWDPRTGERRMFVEFSDGIMDIGTRQARALVRTSVSAVSASARREMLQANADIVKGVQQVSTLDNRTSEICLAYSGKVWLYPDMRPDGHSLPYLGGVPSHWSCRSG